MEYYQPHLELRFLCAHFEGGLVAQGRSKGVKQLSPESVPVLVMDTSQAYRPYVVAPKLKNTFFFRKMEVWVRECGQREKYTIENVP